MAEAACGHPEVLNSQGLTGHSLVLFWIVSSKFEEVRYYYKIRLVPNKFYIIGCDEEDRRNLLRYRKHFDGSIITSQKLEGVKERVWQNNSPEMSPNISYYSEDEYPHRDFALTCGIRSSFCFPFLEFVSDDQAGGIMEIVSTHNQEVGVVRKFCEYIEAPLQENSDWSKSCFQSNTVPKYEYAIPELDRLLEGVCQKFHLPLTQYYYRNEDEDDEMTLVHQFSYRDYENLAPWCHFKDACFHMRFGAFEGPLGVFSESREAFFCKDITALSITQYPFAHYARNCGSIACFTILLDIISPIDEEYEKTDEEYEETEKEYVLEFFLPSQEMDNDYTQTLFNFIWATLKKCLLNFKQRSGEQFGQVLSVKIINSSTQTEPEYFEIGQPQSSLPHHEGSTLKLFENGPDHRSNSDSYEEATTGETSKRILNEASERVDNLVQVSPDEDVATTASKRLKKSKIPCTAENISKHFGRPLKDAAESFGVSVSTFKRRCREVDISWWQPGKRKIIEGEPGKKTFSPGMPNRPVVTNASQDFTMTIKVAYNTDKIRFELNSSSGIAELENSVIERLPLKRKCFSLKYQDEEDDWILIACDKDVQECMKISRSLKKTTIKMLLGPPIDNYAP